MNDETAAEVHFSFWVIGALALIWNLLGAINFLVQMNPPMLDAYRESERVIIETRPLWATIAFGVAAFGGVAGCLLLLLRSTRAFYLFIGSLFGVIVTMVHSLGTGFDFGPGEILGIILLPVVVAVLLPWYSKWVERKGWLKST